MSYLRDLCLLAHSGVQRILCFCIAFLRLVRPMLPISLDCPFFIDPKNGGVDRGAREGKPARRITHIYNQVR
jgi:hypothetical protein